MRVRNSGGSRRTGRCGTASSSTPSSTAPSSTRLVDVSTLVMSRRLRVFAGGLGTETNSFSRLPTGYDDFAKAEAGDSTETRDRIFFGRSFRAYEAVARERRADLVLGSYCFATPGGPPPAAVYARLRDELLAELEA